MPYGTVRYMTTTKITFRTVAIDTPDPKKLAQFYCDLTGGKILRADDEWVETEHNDGHRLSFQLATDFVAPTWPDPKVPQQMHPDFYASEYGPAHEHALSLGAKLLEDESGHEGFRVYADPDGHPFCICLDG